MGINPELFWGNLLGSFNQIFSIFDYFFAWYDYSLIGVFLILLSLLLVVFFIFSFFSFLNFLLRYLTLRYIVFSERNKRIFMRKTLHFFGFLFLLTLVAFAFIFARFFIWNKDFQEDFGLDSLTLRKADLSDVLDQKGEKTLFSLPTSHVSELRVSLVGESLRIEQVEGLQEIQAEIYYPEARVGETYTKIDYQLISSGDRASFITDKKIWKSWKSQKGGTHKLLVGYVVIKIPADLQVLKVSTISGESQLNGVYSVLDFISFSGDLHFKGEIKRASLETFKAHMFLEGIPPLLNKFDFTNLYFRSVLGNLTGQGNVQNLNVTAFSSALNWQGSWENFGGQFLFLRLNLVLKSILRGDWNLYALSGSMDIELPKGAKRESSYGFWQRKDLIDESLSLVVKSFGLGLNYLI